MKSKNDRFIYVEHKGHQLWMDYEEWLFLRYSEETWHNKNRPTFEEWKESKMKTQDKFEFIDEFLAYLEDTLKGKEGDDCSRSRRYLGEIKEKYYYYIDNIINKKTE